MRLSLGVWVVVALAVVAAGWGRPEVAALVAIGLGSLLAHEAAHAVAARLSGYSVDAVRLSLFGGEARWSGPDPAPHVAVRIAAAGPFASGVLACAFAAAGEGPLARAGASVNLLGAAANLLPVPGLDGWALLRGIIAARQDSAREVIRVRRAASRSANQGCSTDQT